MKLVSISLGAWLIALLSIMLTFSVALGQTLSATNASSAPATSLMVSALLFSLAYAPALFWLRKRLGGCNPKLLFPLVSGVVLNVPVFLIEILAIGRTLAPSQSLASIAAFLLMGTVFGLGFVWKYRDSTL